MANLSEEKREVLAYIDAILTMIEKYPTLNLNGIVDDINLGVSVNPFDFLLSIISKQVTDSEMIEWLVNILTYSLPSIELGVKGILLSNLKQTIDCNNDPIIPEWVRQNITYSNIDNNPTDNYDRGFIFNLKNIDYNNLLSYSPISEQGQMKYFGTKSYYEINYTNNGENIYKKCYSYFDAVQLVDKLNEEAKNNIALNPPKLENVVHKSEIDTVYELARASDFNAFLWFVINKAHFLSPTTINESELKNYTKRYDLGDGTFLDRVPFENNPEGTSVLDCFSGEFKTSGSIMLPFVPGSTIIQQDPSNSNFYNTLSLCIKNISSKAKLKPLTNDDGYDFGSTEVLNVSVVTASAPKTNKFTLVPVSSNYKSANWYVNSGTYFNFILPENKRKPRDYSKDLSLCNLQKLDLEDLLVSKVNGKPFQFTSLETYIRFTILPAPLIHKPHIEFTVNSGENLIEYSGDNILHYRRILFDSKGNPDNKGNFTVLYNTREDNSEEKTTTYYYDTGGRKRGEVKVKWENGTYELLGDKTDLIECYPGLTVYDFNYNFVMGMQLFDPSVVASQLLDMATNISMHGSLGLNLSIDKTETYYQMRVAEIVKNIIESTAYEASDCFYTFSNKKYDEMLNDSELKRSQGYEFNNSMNHATVVSLDDAYSILSEFSDNATLEENKDVITRSITQATALITDEVLPEDKYNMKLNIIQELIKGLVTIIVSSLLTPKIILLFEVNKQLMGGHDENLSIEDFIESISGLITSIVIEIRDLILQELMNWAMDILQDLVAKLSSMLVMEKLEYYTRIMTALLKACTFRMPKRKLLDTQLDYVDYADIDEIDQPKTSDC